MQNACYVQYISSYVSNYIDNVFIIIIILHDIHYRENRIKNKQRWHTKVTVFADNP